MILGKKKSIIIGVTGSIAAYKSAEIVSALVRKGYDATVVMTENATKFITPLTLETLSKNKVYVDMFRDEDHSKVTHINLAIDSELILIAPATYNIIGKTVMGVADDLLSSVLAAAPSNKVIFAPAMNVNMYANPAIVDNIKILSDRGYSFIEPDEGILACGVSGKGRLRNVPAILESVDAHFCEKRLQGKKVLITAGATREYIDPIRFLSNTSSGLMGVSLAKVCRDMGAEVTLILANSHLDIEGVKLIRVDTVNQMYESVLKEFENTEIVFSAAAVSDFKPKTYSESKIKKTTDNPSIELEMNKDILFELGKRKVKQFLVGFAAESDNLLQNAQAKLEKKNLDMIIANHITNFSSKQGKVWVVSHTDTIELDTNAKEILAFDIVSTVLDRWCKA